MFVALARILGSHALVRDVLAGLVLGFGLFTAFTQYLGRVAAGRADADLLT